MRKVSKYEAFDGVLFNTERECHEHEHKECNNIINTIKEIKEICVKHGTDCKGCPFYTGSLCIIAQMTDTEFDLGCSPNLWKGTFKLD